MPRLSEFYGIVVYMYWPDHQPPHLHAIYGGKGARADRRRRVPLVPIEPVRSP